MNAIKSVMTRPRIVLGTGLWGLYEGSIFNSGATFKPVLETLRTNNVLRIDTARRYPSFNSGTSEQVLGEHDLSDFTIDTKVWSMPGRHKPAELQRSIDESLAALNVPKINILYLHFPDTETPFEELLQGITEIHKQGKFNTFGTSNFTIPQIKEILAISASKGYMKPSVYQGQYNPLSRDGENELIPLLCENDISFVAYSPAAGGAFNKNSSRLNAQNYAGEILRKTYGYPSAIEAMENIRNAAEKYGITGHAVALRPEQLQPTIDTCNAGPLPDEIVQLMEDVWAAVNEDAPGYCG